MSENRFGGKCATSLPKFHGAAAWMDEFLYFVLEVKTPGGKAFVDFETILHPAGISKIFG